MASAIRLEIPFTLPNQAKLSSSCMCTANQKEPALITTSDRITFIEMPACELLKHGGGGRMYLWNVHISNGASSPALRSPCLLRTHRHLSSIEKGTKGSRCPSRRTQKDCCAFPSRQTSCGRLSCGAHLAGDGGPEQSHQGMALQQAATRALRRDGPDGLQGARWRGARSRCASRQVCKFPLPHALLKCAHRRPQRCLRHMPSADSAIICHRYLPCSHFLQTPLSLISQCQLREPAAHSAHNAGR